MIRFHVLHDEDIERPAAECRGEILKELIGHGDVRGIHQDGLVVEDDIVIVRNAVRKRKDILEAGETVVARADCENVFGNSGNVLHDAKLLSYGLGWPFFVLLFDLARKMETPDFPDIAGIFWIFHRRCPGEGIREKVSVTSNSIREKRAISRRIGRG